MGGCFSRSAWFLPLIFVYEWFWVGGGSEGFGACFSSLAFVLVLVPFRTLCHCPLPLCVALVGLLSPSFVRGASFVSGVLDHVR